jgi:hypothetical protein
LQLRQLSGLVVERSAGGFRQEATLREASEATSGRGSKKVLNEDLMENIRSIGSCGNLKPLGSTAGCGRPHVRWCGRGNGRNPVTSTRSRVRPFPLERGRSSSIPFPLLGGRSGWG